MKRIAIATLLTAASTSLLVLAQTTPPATPLSYRFDDVRRTVTVASANKEQNASKGFRAVSGDKVHTGWFSYALIASEQHKAKFELFSSTDVELAGGSPGVILTVNRGKLHAIFDKVTGNEPRVVSTPGALLAVRGTQYTVDVNDKGETTLDVTEGTVEVRSPLKPEPFFVRAGEAANFSRRVPPNVHPSPRGPNGDHPPNGQGGRGPNGRPGDDHNGPPRPGDPSQGGPGGGPGRGPGGGPGGNAPPPPPPPGGGHRG